MQRERREVPSVVARDVAELRKAAKSLENLAVNDCNYGLSPRQETRRANLAKQVQEIAERYHLAAETSGDPRGCVVKLFDPGDERLGDGFGGGWPVY
jgi:hypothetical protein